MATRVNLWTWKGRLAPRDYWTSVGIIFGIRVVAAIAIAYRPEWDELRHLDFLLGFLAISIGRRMKDFSMAPYWGWVAVAVISFVVPVVVVAVWPAAHDPGRPLAVISPLLGVVTTITLLTLVVAVGVRKSDVGENRYGPGPI